MIPMGEEVEFHLSLANMNHLHEVFSMEASRILLFPILTMLVLYEQSVQVLTLLVNAVQALAVPDIKRKQASMLCHKGEKAPAFSIVGKNIQKNPWPGSLKGAQESVDILGATEFPLSMKLEGCDR